MGIVRDGSLDLFHGHGLPDIASSTQITEDTVFRIGSVTTTSSGTSGRSDVGSMLVRPGTTLRHAREAWPAIRELLAEEPATRTSLDRMVGPDRSLAVIRTTLDEVKAVAHDHAATVNDVLLALTSGGLRTILLGRGEPVEDVTVRTYVPVSGGPGRSPSRGALGPWRPVKQPDDSGDACSGRPVVEHVE